MDEHPPKPAEDRRSTPLTTLQIFLLSEKVSKAEILWCIQTVVSHKSMRSAGSDVNLFKTMFPDSEVAQKMKLQRSTIAYSILYGVAPFYKRNLTDTVQQLDTFVIGFDESLNKVSVLTQMDVNVRFWDTTKNEVVTRYLNSAFLHRARAEDLRANFKEAVKPLDVKKILQIAMDGPSVNHKFFRKLQDEIKTCASDPVVLNMGSCGIHVVYGAFKTGIIATGWEIIKFLRSIYNFFRLYPARRSLYTEYSGSATFPLKFCAVRWLDNVNVAQRAIEIVPNLEKVVAGYVRDKQEPTCDSYKVMKRTPSDPFLTSKLAFFQSLASEAEPFLREYQTDAPLAPFLFSSLTALTSNLMKRFVKEDALTEDSSPSKIDLSSEKNLISPSEVELGYSTKRALRVARSAKEKSMSDLQVLQFRRDARVALVAFVKKLLERSPLSYKLTKAVSSFDPVVASSPAVFNERLKSLLTILEGNNWISGEDADRADRELRALCSRPDVTAELKSYSRSETRLDAFWRDLLLKHGNPTPVLKVMKLVMVLSHGNANVERGFSVNGECLVDNMKNETLVAQRIVYDSVMAETSGDIGQLNISKSLVHSYRNARSRLMEDTERRKAEDESTEEEGKRKRLENKKKSLAGQKSENFGRGASG